MYLEATCKKCGKKGHIDIGDLEISKAKKLLEKQQFGECPFGGFHVEIGNLTQYLDIDYNHKIQSIK